MNILFYIKKSYFFYLGIAIYILFRLFLIDSYIFNNDEIVGFRMIENISDYFVNDIRLPVYDFGFYYIVVKIFNGNILTLRYINLLISIFNLFLLYGISKYIFDRKNRFFLMIFFIFSPFYAFYSIYTESYNFSLFTILSTIYLLFSYKNEKYKLILFFVSVLLSSFTHLLNIIFLFFFISLMFINKKISKRIFSCSIFIMFIPVFWIFLKTFILNIDVNNSILYDFNYLVLSKFNLKNAISVVFYGITGIKYNIEILSIFCVIIISYFILKLLKESENKFLKICIGTSFLYFLTVVIITFITDMKYNSSSFSQDYIMIAAIFFIAAIIYNIKNEKIKFFFIITLTLMFTYVNYVNIVERERIFDKYCKLKNTIKNNSYTFLISEKVTLEALSKDMVKTLFQGSDYIFVEDEKNIYPDNIVFPSFFEYELYSNIDEKILVNKNRNIEAFLIKNKKVLNFLTSYEKVDEIFIGDLIFTLFKRKSHEF